MTDIEEKLWSRSVPMENGCRVWVGGYRNPLGYGMVWYLGRMRLAHRVSCELAHGPAPEDKPLALHRCDNPPCIEPSHLYWGDYSDNMKDRVQRGLDHNTSKTYCPQGHEYSTENTYIITRQGYDARACRTCKNSRALAHYYRSKESIQ